MSLLFRKRIKLAPGVHINISKSGLSLNLGVPGLNTTIGRNKKTTIGLPGSGLYFQTTNSFQPSIRDVVPEHTESPIEHSDNVLSVSPDVIDAGNMAVINKLYKDVLENKCKLSSELDLATSEKRKLQKRLFWLKMILIGFLPAVKDPLNGSIEFYGRKIKEIVEDQEVNVIDIKYEMDDRAEMAHEDLRCAFTALTKVDRVWDINRVELNDKTKTRSLASKRLKREMSKAMFSEIPMVRTSQMPMKMINVNGPDIYFCPSFVVFRNHEEFAAIDYDKLEISYLPTNFLEEDDIPNDAEIVGTTWEKVNKNGSRDRRFSDNRQIPIMQYGELTFRMGNFIHEIFMVSNHEVAEAFFKALVKYQKGMRRIRKN